MKEPMTSLLVLAAPSMLSPHEIDFCPLRATVTHALILKQFTFSNKMLQSSNKMKTDTVATPTI
jgi:hypothetical protein